MTHKFQPGEYTTRGGHEAVVRYSDTWLYGEVRVPNRNMPMMWYGNGNACYLDSHAYGLLPPATVTYRALPCEKHRGWWNPETDSLPVTQCDNCRVERIERVDGVVTKVEVVE